MRRGARLNRTSPRWRYFGTPPFSWLHLSVEAVFDHLPTSWQHCSRADAFLALMEADAARHGKLRCGDKTPAHALVLDELLAAFPLARVVHIVRDPRAVVASLARMPWAPPSHVANALGCLASTRAVLACEAAAGERMLTIRYEDLIADPEATLRAVCEHVGVAWDARVLAGDAEPAGSAAAAVDAVVGSVPWLRQKSEPLTARPVCAPTATTALQPFKDRVAVFNKTNVAVVPKELCFRRVPGNPGSGGSSSRDASAGATHGLRRGGWPW